MAKKWCSYPTMLEIMHHNVAMKGAVTKNPCVTLRTALFCSLSLDQLASEIYFWWKKISND